MLEESPNQVPKSTYAKIATILASTAGISFGLCAVSVFTGGRNRVMEYVPMIFASLVVLSLAGLVILVLAYCISRFISPQNGNKN